MSKFSPKTETVKLVDLIGKEINGIFAQVVSSDLLNKMQPRERELIRCEKKMKDNEEIIVLHWHINNDAGYKFCKVGEERSDIQISSQDFAKLFPEQAAAPKTLVS